MIQSIFNPLTNLYYVSHDKYKFVKLIYFFGQRKPQSGQKDKNYKREMRIINQFRGRLPLRDFKATG